VSSVPPAGQGPFYGKYRGIVRDNADPLQLGRITATVPAVLGEQTTGWALPCTPYAGDGVGSFTIPPAGAGVWIEFEGGNLDHPIWVGGWWGDGQAPAEESGRSGVPGLKVLRSGAGHVIALDDDDRTITISDRDGRNLLTIEVTQGQVTMQAAATAVVEAPTINLVERSTHPIVFGDVLTQYLNMVVNIFNSHLHPGQTAVGVLPVTPAPPVPILTPPTPSLLSTRVTSG
jgi:hypothetical protein